MPRWAARLHGDPHVLECGEIGKHAQDLKRTAQAQSNAPMHRQGGHLLPPVLVVASSGARSRR